jgi:hypothetical protein
MTTKRRLLTALTRADLLLLGRAFELQVSPRMSLDELQGELSRSKRAMGVFGNDGIAAVEVEAK